jgi:imidazoleglycerol-phosphate dehydratase
MNAGVDLHVERSYGHNVHHILEGIFKGLGRALDEATAIDPRIRGALSTKGSL